jgi:adenine-specific DNA-methyltransferase
MPKHDWIAKQYIVNHTDVPFRLLDHVPDASVGEESKNIIVHGDNLEALKVLIPYYQERVKLVFIDPLYNTGNEKLAYNNRRNAPKIKEWLSRVVGGENEDLTT